MIVFCRSSDFKSIFPNNTNLDFKHQLPQLTQFSQDSKVALLEIFLPPCEKTYIAHVYTNIISVCPIGSKTGRLLRIVSVAKSTEYQHIQFACPVYQKLACTAVEEIQIYLKTFDGEDLKLDDKNPTIVILQFK
jgi:hypothetical protein